MEGKKSKCTFKCHDFKKTKYATEKEAQADLKRIGKKSTRDKVPIRSYQCNYCKLWLLTSKEDKLEPLYQEIEGYKTLLDIEKQKLSEFQDKLIITVKNQIGIMQRDTNIDHSKKAAYLRAYKWFLKIIER